MGKLTGKGINGPFTGKAGSVSGSSRNGVPYIKGPTKYRTKNISVAEKLNRTAFSTAQYWLKPVLNYLREGFKVNHITSNSFITAKSYLMKNAVEGVKPDTHINPALVKVSSGTLFSTESASVELTADYMVEFTWDTKIIENGSSKDQTMLLAYDIENKRAYLSTIGQFRYIGKDSLRITNTKGRTYHVYLAFNAYDRNNQSDSMYLGTITT